MPRVRFQNLLAPAAESGPDSCFHTLLTGVQEQLDGLKHLVSALAAEHERELGCATRVVDKAALPYVLPQKRPLPVCKPDAKVSSGAIPAYSLGCMEHDVKTHVSSSGLVHKDLAAEGADRAEDSNTEFDCNAEGGEDFDTASLGLDDRLRLALCGDSDERASSVLKLLRKSADPNAEFTSFQFNGMEFVSGSPLVLAVLSGDHSLVRCLVEHKAHLESKYSFRAGAAQAIWSGPASHCIVPHGDLDMLKELVKLSADVHAQGSNSATLLWQAAYFDKPQMLEYLLEERVDLELRAQSQDDGSLKHSPLHVAANAENTKAVKVLLEARANVRVSDGKGTRPLLDAIQHGHSAVAKLLVAHAADVFEPLSASGKRRSPSTRRDALWSLLVCSPTRSIDVAFQSKNPGLVAALVEGLKGAPALVDNLTNEDIVQFLSCPGEGARAIFDVVFQQHDIKYWEQSPSGMKRMRRTAAYISTRSKIVFAEGPHSRHIDQLFRRKQAGLDMVEFVDRLAPKRKAHHCMYVQVVFFMCHVKGIHTNLNVLRAIADCPHEKVFEQRGCEAIVNLNWEVHKRLARCSWVMKFVEVINLQLISFIVKSHTGSDACDVGSWGQVACLHLVLATLMACVLCALMLVEEVATAVGYFSCGLGWRYLLKVGTWWCNLELVSCCLIMAELVWRGSHVEEDQRFNVRLGMLVFTKWLWCLFAMRQQEAIGLRILPIASTIKEVGPFCFVLFVCLLASASFYFQLGLHSLPDSFIMLYRLLALADIDLQELTGATETWTIDAAEQRIHKNVNQSTSIVWVVQAMVFALTFSVGISMMNIFIAIVCQSYQEAASAARLTFMRSRTCTVLDRHAFRLGLRLLCCGSCSRRQKTAPAEFSPCCIPPNKEAFVLSEGSGDEDGRAYIWYAIERVRPY